MLEKLIGAQIVNVNSDSIKVELNGSLYELEIISNDGDCCGYASFETKLLYSENDTRNPIITNVTKDSRDDSCGESSTVTFYGESKALAQIESDAGSGSGYYYGSFVTLECKALDIDEDLASW